MLLFFFLVIHFLKTTGEKITETDETGKYLKMNFDENSDPFVIAEESCQNEFMSCMYTAVNAVERIQALRYNKELKGWRFNEHCNCSLPPRPEKQDILQFFHIPKTGTALNWFLHDYFENCTDVMQTEHSGEPCTRWLQSPEEQVDGLCDGRLYSCSGHRVAQNIFDISSTVRTNLVTLLRHPWSRLSSDYYYFRRKPQSAHLSPEVNTTHLLENTHSILEHALYPGIANCATKMMNGIQCGEIPDPPLNFTHINRAKQMLMIMIFFGITEHFKSSVCLMAWMHGGDPQPSHFAVSRQGDYPRQTMEEALTAEELAAFKESERYDLELYEFGKDVFLNRMELSGCPLID